MTEKISLEDQAIINIANRHQRTIDSTYRRMIANLIPLMEKVLSSDDEAFVAAVKEALPKNCPQHWEINQYQIRKFGK